MADDQERLDPRRRGGDQSFENIHAGGMQRRFNCGGRRRCEFAFDDFESLAGAARRRDEDKIRDQTRLAKISADALGVGASGRRERSFEIAIAGIGLGFGMAKKKEPQHEASRNLFAGDN